MKSKRLGEVEIALDTIKTIQEIHERAVKSNWTPGTPSMTEEDHLEVLEQLRKNKGASK